MDKEIIDEIYRENAAMIYKYLCGLTQDSGLAEELTQETFFQAVKGIDKFRGDCKVSVWLCGIAKKLWYKELEKRSRHKTVPLDDCVPSAEKFCFLSYRLPDIILWDQGQSGFSVMVFLSCCYGFSSSGFQCWGEHS